MKGFLSKFLRNQKVAQKPSFQLRQEPTVISSRHALHENELHPDETFIDYEGSNEADLISQELHDTWPASLGQKTNNPKTDVLQSNSFIEALKGETWEETIPDRNVDQLETTDTTTSQEAEYDTVIFDEFLEEFDESPVVGELNQAKDEALQKFEPLTASFLAACAQCGTPFSDFKAAIRLYFCPFCGAKQNDKDTIGEKVITQIGSKFEKYDIEENITDEGRTDTLRVSDVSGTKYSLPVDEPQLLKKTDNNRFGYSFKGKDKNFDIDLELLQEFPRGSNSLDDQQATLGDWDSSASKINHTEDWEIFLNEDLEEQKQFSDQYFEDEDPLEQGKIAVYAAQLMSRIAIDQSRDRRSSYELFITILGDFPFYQSYAALERMMTKGLQIDHISDAYLVKLIWMNNPNSWADRRYSKMERMWVTSRKSKLKNSMSWQLASDLVGHYNPNELENLILNDWHDEWLTLPDNGADTPSGIDPAFSLYSTYLYHKSSQNTW